MVKAMITNRFTSLSLVVLASIAASSCASSQTPAPKPAPAPAPAQAPAAKPAAPAQQPATAAKPASGRQPNILFIMGDDVGWFNVGAYHQGIMSGKTPNLDKLAREGV